jgi:hypothetical protein
MSACVLLVAFCAAVSAPGAAQVAGSDTATEPTSVAAASSLERSTAAVPSDWFAILPTADGWRELRWGMTQTEVATVFGREFKKLPGRKQQSFRNFRSAGWHGELRKPLTLDGLPFNVRFGFANNGSGGLEEIGFKYEKFGNKAEVDRSLVLFVPAVTAALGEGKIQERKLPSEYAGTEPDAPEQAKQNMIQLAEWQKDRLYISRFYQSGWMNALMKVHQITISFNSEPASASP